MRVREGTRATHDHIWTPLYHVISSCARRDARAEPPNARGEPHVGNARAKHRSRDYVINVGNAVAFLQRNGRTFFLFYVHEKRKEKHRAT